MRLPASVNAGPFRRGRSIAFKGLIYAAFILSVSSHSWSGRKFPFGIVNIAKRTLKMEWVQRGRDESRVDKTWIFSQTISSKFSFPNVFVEYASATLWKLNYSPESHPTFSTLIWHPVIFDFSTESQRGDSLMTCGIWQHRVNPQCDITVVSHYSACSFCTFYIRLYQAPMHEWACRRNSFVLAEKILGNLQCCNGSQTF